MTAYSRRVFESARRNGEPCSVRHYERIMDDLLAGCNPDEIEELYPFTGEGDTNVAYAIFRLKVDEWLGN